MEVYAAMVDRLDQGIGRILDALNEWNEHPDLGPKELDESDVGLDYERWLELEAKLKKIAS